LSLLLVFGTRPQIIKSVPVIRECLTRGLNLTTVNTGQHYDFEMSKVFIEQLSLPDPHFSLGVGSGSHAQQTAKIMTKIEKLVVELRPSVCVVPGDTNSAIGTALGAVKAKIPVAHLEAGLRSREEFMPEEINRRLIDHCSQVLFAPTKNAVTNLSSEGIERNKIFLTGDTMYDLFLSESSKILNAKLPEVPIKKGKYLVMTLHREQNTSTPETLREILSAIKEFGATTVFPIHPRTKNVLRKSGLLKATNHIENLILIDPLPYHSMMRLIKDSEFVITDSGGIQKEAFMAATPCLTLRESTEWVETIKLGANVLVSSVDCRSVVRVMKYLSSNRKNIIHRINRSGQPYGNGKAAKKVVDILQNRYSLPSHAQPG